MTNKKGFTVAELLMVVAIIGMLVALSIPIFSEHLEKSRDAVTVANLRNAYAEAQTAYLTETSSGNAIYKPVDGEITTTRTTPKAVTIVEVSGVVAKGKAKNNFSKLTDSLPFKDKMVDCEVMDNTPATYTVIFEYEASGAIIKVSCKATNSPIDNQEEAAEIPFDVGDAAVTYMVDGQNQALRIYLEGFDQHNSDTARKYLDFTYDVNDPDSRDTTNPAIFIMKSNKESFIANGIAINQENVEQIKTKLEKSKVKSDYHTVVKSVELVDQQIIVKNSTKKSPKL
ncbi:type IV pilin protein [Granulicatella balaenopterae]|nr:prepilin-type N-terminal cleavage/methylation domain-containing protein [Granulicatella balaenopterae]